MRVRDAIWKEIVRASTIWLIVVALVFVGLELLPDNFSRLFWIPIAIIVISIPSAFLAGSNCPQCAFSLYGLGFRLRFGDPRRRINHCPGCGLDLDTDLSQVVRRQPAARPPMIHIPFLLGFGMVMAPAVLYLTNNDPKPSGAEPALVLLGSIGAASATFAFHRIAKDRHFSSALVAPGCGAICAVVFYTALSLLYHGVHLYAAIFLALALTVLLAWLCPRSLGKSS
jgi:hypothetical protein